MGRRVNILEEFKPGCKRPAVKKPVQEIEETKTANVKEEKEKIIKVRKPVSDFASAGYHISFIFHKLF